MLKWIKSIFEKEKEISLKEIANIDFNTYGYTCHQVEEIFGYKYSRMWLEEILSWARLKFPNVKHKPNTSTPFHTIAFSEKDFSHTRVMELRKEFIEYMRKKYA